jgi:polysaccharide pyruvyl transferase WcaK-like protein
MSEVIRASAELIRHICKTYGARVVLISAYQLGEMAWEDDQPWLRQVKERLAEDDDVILIEQPLSLSGYCYLISRLQLVIGSRLHTTLTSLRLGVPAINLNYTLKGRDIFDHLGLGRYVEELTTFMADPSSIYHMIDDILKNHAERTMEVTNKVQNAKRENEVILKDVFQCHNLAP